MGESELKIALQREGEVQVRDFWKQAEMVVVMRRKELETELHNSRTETERQLLEATTGLRNSLLFEARARSHECQLHTEAELEARLLLLARRLLPELAGHDRSALWQVLYEELPEADWSALTVHPADRKLAERHFAAASIDCDANLSGGLIASNADGTVRIDNSLDCRLMRAWPDLQPKLLTELREWVDKDETSHTDTTG